MTHMKDNFVGDKGFGESIILIVRIENASRIFAVRGSKHDIGKV